MRNSFAIGALAAAVCAVPASAAHFVFDSASANLHLVFDMADSPTPSFALPGLGFGVIGTVNVNGSDQGVTTVFLNQNYGAFTATGIVGGFTYNASLSTAFYGTQLYSGAEGAPTFLAGTYALLQYRTGFAGTLVISDVKSPVPEPMTWAMMVGGFGLVGGAMRRRNMVVTYA